MIDIKLIRENKELVKENIKKKFQDAKLPLVDEIEALDKEFRECKTEGDNLRALKNSKSAEIGLLMRDKKIEDANKIKTETENVEIEKFGDPVVPSYEIPHHADILEKLNGLDKESSARTSGYGFYYLMGDAARLHSAMLSYARDFMISKGFTYCIPPFMIRSDVVTGVMSFAEMDAMMYKIEGADGTVGANKNSVKIIGDH